MKFKGISFSLLVSVLVIIFSMVFLSNQSFSIINGGDFNDPNLWLCHRNATIENGRVYLIINETEGRDCFYSSVQQGIYPHGWDKKDSIREIEVRRGIEVTKDVMFIRIIANRSEFQFYNETESIVNIGVMLWIQLDENYHKPINESEQLELDINFASFLYGWYSNYTVMPITWDSHFKGFETGEDNDYHYIDSAFNVMLESNKTYEITIDVGESIGKAFEYFNIQKGTLKSFDVYIEAKYGYGEATIEYVEFYFKPKINSGYVMAQSGLYGFVTFFALFFISMILKRM